MVKDGVFYLLFTNFLQNMQYFLRCFKKYAVFKGRAQRSEYWYFILFTFLITFVINSITTTMNVGSTVDLVIAILYILVFFVPGLAVLVRRLHDTNHSGWWSLVSLLAPFALVLPVAFVLLSSIGGGSMIWWPYLISVVGFILALVVLVFLVRDSDTGDNKYGPNPKVSSAIA